MITKSIMIALLLIAIPFIPQVSPLPAIVNTAIDTVVAGLLLAIKMFPSFGDLKLIALLTIGLLIGKYAWKITKTAMGWIFGSSN